MKISLIRGKLSSNKDMPIPSKENILNSKNIGNIGEAYVIAKFVEMHIPVYQQFGDNEASDIIVLINNKPLKIQIKTSTRSDENRVVFDLTSCSFHRRCGNRHKYTLDEVDAFACYDYRTKYIFLIRNIGDMTAITLRYKYPKNNQKSGVHYYANYFLCVEALHEMSI